MGLREVTLPPAAKFFGSPWEISLYVPLSTQLGSLLRDLEHMGRTHIHLAVHPATRAPGRVCTNAKDTQMSTLVLPQSPGLAGEPKV